MVSGGCSKQRGFSLVEALVVLMISSVLMALLSRIYLSTEWVHRSLSEYTSENRSAFYARQQLRGLIDSIVYPPGYGRTIEETLGTRSPFLSREEDNESALTGAAQSVSGALKNNLTGNGTITNFTLEIVPTDQTINSPFRGQVRLRFEDDSDTFVLALHRLPIASFEFIDRNGQRHAEWPPVADPFELRRRRIAATNSIAGILSNELFLQESRILPKSLVIRFGRETQQHTLVMNLNP